MIRGIYARKFPPQLIPVHDLTHLLYAFGNVKPDTGEVFISDPWADKDIHYPGDRWDEPGNNLYGNLKAIYLIKKHNRNLKTLFSIGGWTYSSNFHPVVVSPPLRAKFVESAVKILEDYGFDGLDIDYEYPTNDDQAKGFVNLLKELRSALDHHAEKKKANYRFLLSIAAPCGPEKYEKLHVAEMNKSLDFWNLMAYDFSGSWDTAANHMANLHGGTLNGSQAIDWYIKKGVAANKIVLGIPIYGRSFMNTEGIGKPFHGVGIGTWEPGTYDYRVLPLPGSTVHNDLKAVASWSYDSAKKELVSFDDEKVAQLKGKYIVQKGLGGAMFWELSGDKGFERPGIETGPGKDEQPGKNLVHLVKGEFALLEDKHNWLGYEDSQYDNMKKGMKD
ncbi:glycoside hydrolase family 18 protein [Amanita thiersii Skay4041]|uniref:chitinase n=1 Tax=Amanita thiersii Skay4041 TaxID=703135 RepID=A0A2A9N7N8_9AGAR|nr:glycoside hydrolase family 18 protein [Amanita thiersii Skay4041]